MPLRGNSRRGLTDRDLEALVNAEDSNDEDYDDRGVGPSRSRKSKPRRSGSELPRKKQKRRGYRGSDISDDEDEEESDNDEPWTDEEEMEEIETNERGRPVRKSAKQQKTYEESDPEEDDLLKTSSESEAPLTPPVSKLKRKVVTLKIRTPLLASTTTGRPRRNRSGSVSNKPQSSAAPAPTRRSRRLSHEDDEPIVELSSSGRHANVVRAGSHDPEQPVRRPTRGSKGIKYPSKSTIDEEDEPESAPQYDTEPLEIEASQHEEIPATQPELPENMPQLLSDLPPAVEATGGNIIETSDPLQRSPEREPIAPEVEPLTDVAEEEGDDDDDDMPVIRGRPTRVAPKRKAMSPPADEPAPGRRRLRSRETNNRASNKRVRRAGPDDTSDFDPEGDHEDAEEMSESAESDASPRKGTQKVVDDYESSNAGRRSTRLQKKAASRQASGSDDEEDELREELAELKKDGSKRKRSLREEVIFEPRGRRAAGRKNYDLLRNMPQIEEDDEPAAPSPSQRTRKTGGTGWQRTLLSTYGPFGGAGGRSLLGGPPRPADGDSDSSDDEIMKQPKPIGGTAGMTPTTAATPFNPFALQSLNSDPVQGPSGTPANLGKMKDKQALADADPLGVDQNVDFDSVGGLAGHIDQLKEMVVLPLLYPEIFMRFKITPPRGVLFHGPPGTGKTLLARALATSVSSQGRKVTFYMRKGADALSKWVGEAERQLRMLFEEARKNQPSIIFFDEIDGLAPVRSSKQEQIHASIVSTLLALMDGMDGRGQVIVIGATNRPDSIDPALRRPGRFDREFYFPLPDTEARRAILQIHTRGWNPPLDDRVKDELAEMTKGYGGADLRALCTEAALNAVQRRYPQIYKSKEKLLIDPKTITVTPKDFMISIKKMTPSSERSASSGASTLPESIRPLLERPLSVIQALIADLLPQKKKTTALEEAMYEDVADGQGFGREKMQQAFESSRVFRPRLLIHGKVGMGQQYVAAALLNHFQGVHVQSFDLSTLLSDTTSSPEATVIRLFAEVKIHKPSVIYIPNVQEWYATVSSAVLTTFFGLLRSIKPTDPVLVLGFSEAEPDQEDDSIKRDLFGYSKRNRYHLEAPNNQERRHYFHPIKKYIKTRPSDFPDPTKRKKRQMEILPPAPPEPEKAPKPLTKEELKAQKKRDRQTLNMLKIRLQPIMDQIRGKYKKFRTGVIEENAIRYLYDEADPGTVTSDVAQFPIAQASFRPYEVGKDAHGVPGLVDQANGKFYYNLDTVTIEKRLSNGYYKRPKDFLADIKRLAKDAKAIEDEDRLLKANELLANVEVDIASIELSEPVLAAECEKVYQREIAREKEVRWKEQAAQAGTAMPPPQHTILNGSAAATTTTEGTGQIRLGETFYNAKDTLGKGLPVTPSRPPSSTSAMTNGYYRGIAAAGTTGHRDSNHTGSGHEADAEGDTPMHITSGPTSNSKTSGETQKTHTTPTTSSFGTGARESAQPRPYHQYTAPSQQLRREHGMANQLSQSEFVTPMQVGSQAADYLNEASTTQTTSGQKLNSGPSDNLTQESGPNLFMYDERRSADGTDVPDTQGMHILKHSAQFNPASSMSSEILRPKSASPSIAQRRTRQRQSQSQPSTPKKLKPLDLSKWQRPAKDFALTLSSIENAMQNSQGSASVNGSSQPSRYVTAPPRSSSQDVQMQHYQSHSHSQSAPPHPPPVPPFDGSASANSAPQTAPAAISGNTNANASRAYPSTTAISNILNPASRPSSPMKSALVQAPNLTLPSDQSLNNMHSDLADKTSGLSVEQLEQVNSILMDVLWKTRDEWDRRKVLDEVVEGFNEVLKDMREVGQDLGVLSWENQTIGASRRLEG